MLKTLAHLIIIDDDELFGENEKKMK